MKPRKKARIAVAVLLACLLFIVQIAIGYASFTKGKSITNNTLGTSTHLAFYFNIVNDGKAQPENTSSPISWGVNQSMGINLGSFNHSGLYILRGVPNLLKITNKTTNILLILSVINGTSPTSGVKLSNLYSTGLLSLTLNLGLPAYVGGTINIPSSTPLGIYTGFIKATDPISTYSMLIPIEFTVY